MFVAIFYLFVICCSKTLLFYLSSLFLAPKRMFIDHLMQKGEGGFLYCYTKQDGLRHRDDTDGREGLNIIQMAIMQYMDGP